MPMRLLPLIPALLMLNGCALHYVDGAGNRHAVGLLHVTQPPLAPQDKGADWMRMRTLGLVFSRTEIGGAVELGYSDNTFAAIHNNSCVVLPEGAEHAASPSSLYP